MQSPDRDSNYDVFKKAILKDYIGGSLFSINNLMSLVKTTHKTGISSIEACGEYLRQFRDIASHLVSSGYLCDHDVLLTLSFFILATVLDRSGHGSHAPHP